MSTHSPPFRVPAFQVEQHDPLVDDEHGVMPWMIDSRGSKYEISKTLRSLDRLLALIDVKVLLKRACVGLNKSSQTTALLLQPNTRSRRFTETTAALWSDRGINPSLKQNPSTQNQ